MASGLSWFGFPFWLPGSRVWRRLSEITGPNLAATIIAGEKGKDAGGTTVKENWWARTLRRRHLLGQSEEHGGWSPDRWLGGTSRTPKL